MWLPSLRAFPRPSLLATLLRSRLSIYCFPCSCCLVVGVPERVCVLGSRWCRVGETAFANDPFSIIFLVLGSLSRYGGGALLYLVFCGLSTWAGTVHLDGFVICSALRECTSCGWPPGAVLSLCSAVPSRVVRLFYGLIWGRILGPGADAYVFFAVFNEDVAFSSLGDPVRVQWIVGAEFVTCFYCYVAYIGRSTGHFDCAGIVRVISGDFSHPLFRGPDGQHFTRVCWQDGFKRWGQALVVFVRGRRSHVRAIVVCVTGIFCDVSDVWLTYLFVWQRDLRCFCRAWWVIGQVQFVAQ